jgi:hypothetical protein
MCKELNDLVETQVAAQKTLMQLKRIYSLLPFGNPGCEKAKKLCGQFIDIQLKEVLQRDKIIQSFD